MTDSTTDQPALANVQGIAHVRLTVTDIHRSKAFYSQLLGMDPAIDMSDQADQPGVTESREKFYGGCAYQLGSQVLGLRPSAPSGDRFDSTRVGLDHVSLLVGSVDELDAAKQRLDAAGVEHGDVTDLGEYGMTILSLQDPDDINVELCAQT